MTIWVFQGGTASWFDDASWLSTAQPPANGVPGAGDTAEIGSGTADMGSNSDTIAALDLTGGDLIGTGTLSATGGSQWSSGYIGESLVVALSGTSVLGGVQIGGSATVENFGTVTDTGNLSLGDSSGTSATLLNEAGATFNIANAITIGNGASTALFTNMGTIATLAGSGTSAIAAIDNTGTIKIAANTAVQLGGTTTEVGGTISGSGTLILGSIGNGGAEYLESSAVLSVATILITGQYPDVVLNGNITYNGNFLVEASSSLFGGNAAPIDLNGQTLTLGGKVTLASSTFEYGAVWIGGGGTLVTKGATVVPAANQALTLGSGTTWSNAGSVQERGNLQLGDQSGIDVTFTNQSTGTVDFTASASISSDDPTSSFFNNAGLLEVGNRTSSGAVQANIVNTGTITAIAGQLTLGTGGSATSSTGLITASAGGTVYVQDGLANTGSITAAANSLVWLQAGGSLGGTIGGGGGHVYLAGDFGVLSSVTQSVAFANGAGFSGVGAGEAYLTGAGTLTSSGTVAITANGGTSLDLGDGVTWLNSGTVNDGGVTEFGAAGGDTVSLINAAGAVINVSGSGDVFQVGDGTAQIVNRGLIAVNSRGGTSDFNVALTNTGTFLVAAGNAAVLAGGTFGGLIGGSGSVALIGGWGVATGQTDSVHMVGTGVSFSGVGLSTAYLSGAGTIATVGTMAIANNGGTSLQLGYDVTWLNKGVVTDSGFTQLGAADGDSVVLENAAGATFTIIGTGTVVENYNGGGEIINNGLFSVNSGGSSVIDTGIVNTGSLSAASGSTLVLTGGTLGGTIGGGGGNVVLTGGYGVSSGQTQTVQFGSGVSFSGAGEPLAYLSGAGTIATSGTVAVANNNNNSLELAYGVTWLNKNVVNVSNTILFGAQNADEVTLTNASGATLNVLGGGTDFVSSNGGTGTIINNGAIVGTAGGGSIDVYVVNTGTISATAGNTLSLDNGSLGGTIGGGGGNVDMIGNYGISYGTTQTVAFATGASFSGPYQGPAYLDGDGDGRLSSSGTVSINNNPSFALQIYNGVTWQNNGTVNDSGIIYFGDYIGDTATLINAAGATFNVLDGGSVFQDINDGNGTFVNNGALIGNGGFSEINVSVVNTGTISATAGNTLLLDNGSLGGTIGGGGGSVEMIGGYGIASGTTQTVAFAAGAGFSGADQDPFYLSGDGTLSSSGTVSINENPNFALQIDYGVTWQNNGTVNDSGLTYFGIYNGDVATLINAAGATFNVLASGSVLQNAGGGNGTFLNNGTLIGDGGFSEINVSVVNAGRISATAGNTLLLDNGSLGGTIGGGGGSVEMTGGYGIASGTTQTVAFAAGAGFSGADQGPAYLSGDGTLSSGGTVSINENPNFALQIDYGVTWRNNGTVNDSGVTYFGIYNGDVATLINAAGATFNVLASGSVLQNAGGGNGTFLNNGTLIGDGGNSTIAVYVDNTGTISIVAGNTLDFTNGLTNTGTLAATGGTIVLGTGISGTGTALIGTNGTLEIGGSDSQNVTFSGAGAILRLDQPSQFTGSISGLGFSDVLDFTGLSVTSATLASGTLTVASNGGTFAYAVAGALTGTQFQLQSDGGGGTDVVVGVPGQAFTLTTGTDSFLGGIGNDSFIAKTNTLNAGDSLDGAGGTNTLVLSGAGTFNLAAPAALNHITIVQASETGQTITLRAGTADSVNVTSGATADTIIGAANTDVVSLGAAADKITIGGAGETFDGIGTKYSFSAAGQAASALINVATGTSSLAVSGGGTIALNAGDNGLATVTLASSSTAYSFTANAEIGLKITDASSGYDTISAGGIGEILTGGAAGHLTMIGDISGGTTFFDTSALLNGDLIENLATSGSELDVSDLAFSSLAGTFTENTSATMGTLNLTDGTHTTSISIAGSFAAAGFSGSLSAAGFVVSSDGHTGTAIGFH